MSERVGSAYQPLFEVRLLHHYWLDEGSVLFDELPKDAVEKTALNLPEDTPTREQRLKNYDRRTSLTVHPTAATLNLLAALGGIYKDTALGFVVVVPKGRVIPSDVIFEFAISVADASFFNYTSLTLPPQKIFDFYHPHEKRTYRYKTNVFVFSNRTGAARGTGSKKTLFLSSKYLVRSANDTVESLVIVGGALMQLTSDAPNPNAQQINPKATNLPAFIHQGDIPAIVPPVGLLGVPERGIELAEDRPSDIFALVRLAPVRDDDKDFSLVGDDGMAKAAFPIFQLRFRNRSTYWLYFDKAEGKPNGKIDLKKAGPVLPLTFYGNASPTPNKKRKPSASLVKAMLDNSDPSKAKVTGLVSEIFE